MTQHFRFFRTFRKFIQRSRQARLQSGRYVSTRIK